jgi:hypothetical protein
MVNFTLVNPVTSPLPHEVDRGENCSVRSDCRSDDFRFLPFMPGLANPLFLEGEHRGMPFLRTA